MQETESAIVSTQRRGRAIPALYVGLSGDSPTTSPMRVSLRGIDRIDLGRGNARTVTRASRDGADVLEVVLADTRMSSKHARITRIAGSWVLEDLGSKNGTWVGRERVPRYTLGDGDAIVVGHTALVFREAGGEDADLDAPRVIAPGLATLSSTLAGRFAELATTARSNLPIQITGETGTGKELVARAVHALSGRTGKLVPVNCGALPPTLLEAELFGHRKGAFTGAETDRPGLVRSADRGTLFLDEAAELPAVSQAALLRVLQEGEVVPVGDDRAIEVDVRVVTATHKQLDREVEAGRFRADLRARMLGFELVLPPLRDRSEDLAVIAIALLQRLAPDRRVAFSADAVAALYTYAWPLNIRELERALAAALTIATDRIELPHLPPAVRDAKPVAPDDASLRTTLEEALAKHHGNLAAVARELGKDRTQIRRWMKRFGLARDDD